MADKDDPYGLGSDIPDDKIAAALAALGDSRHGMATDCMKDPLYDKFSRDIAEWRLDPDNPQSPTLDDGVKTLLADGVRAIVEGLEAASIPDPQKTAAAAIEKKTRPVLALETALLATDQLKDYGVNCQRIAQRLALQTAEAAVQIARAMGLNHAAIGEAELMTARADLRGRGILR